MTLQREVETTDLFGLAGTFPRPGWAVLDAARSHGFTGELTFDTIPSAKVYLDSGEIYLAERVTDPPLGSRLVDAGALNAAQLEHGLMIVGEVAHLGRLFERVPSVSRHSVLLVTEMMTEECVGWLADQLVRDAVAAPYHHHPAGIQRWLRPVPAPSPEPGDPLPSPLAGDAAIELVADESLFSLAEPLDEDMIQWDQRSWLDDRRPDPPVSVDGVEAEASTTATDLPDEWSQPVVADAPPAADAERPVAAQVLPTSEPAVDQPIAESVLSVDESVAPLEFTVGAVGSWAESVAPGDQPGHDASWLTTPPSVVDPAPSIESPLAAQAGSADPVLGVPTSHDPIEFEPAWPEPVVATDDWADLIAAVAAPQAEPQPDPERADDPAVTIADLASAPEHPDHEPASADSPPAPEFGGLEAALDSVSPASAIAPAYDWPPSPPIATGGVGQFESDSMPESAVPSVDVHEAALMVLPVRSSKSKPGPATAVGDQQVEPVVEFDDWVDRLDTDGLPDAGTDLLNTTKRLPPGPPAPLDRFEVIWPSGEIDEQFGSADTTVLAERQPDLDQVGVTARLKTSPGDVAHDLATFERPADASETGDEVTDEVVLAVRRAVATIETGSLAARRRLVTSPKVEDPSWGIDDSSERVLTPLRHDSSATDDVSRPVVSAAPQRAPTRSVFDDDVQTVTDVPEAALNVVAPAAPNEGAVRTGALRRLIGSLRRR